MLEELGATEQKRIEVINKCDAADPMPAFPGAILISAKTGEGLDDLLELLALRHDVVPLVLTLQETYAPTAFLVPFSRYGILSEIHGLGRVINEEHTETGTKITAMVSREDTERMIRKYGNGILAEVPGKKD